MLCPDADLVFERGYVETALRCLAEDPRSIVVSTMLALPPSWNQLHSVPGENEDGVFAVPRVGLPYARHFAGMSIAEREPLMRDLLSRLSLEMNGQGSRENGR